MAIVRKISAEEFDRIFDEGKEDILQYFDMENAVRLGDNQRTREPDNQNLEENKALDL